jgi:SSS family solute:Na+ symporter
MNLTAVDWAIVFVALGLMIFSVIAAKRLMRSVDDFFINGQMFWAISMFGAAVVYIAVSLLNRKSDFDMDKLLNRGNYAVASESAIVEKAPSRGWRMLGMDKEFTRFDKFIYITNYIWTGGWTLVFIVGTIYNLTHDVSDDAWMDFWRIYLLIHVSLAAIVVFWFATGGLRDSKDMIKRLRTMKRDDADDGFVNRT